MADDQYMAIMDGGADTCVIGKGWTIIDRHPTRQANVVGFNTSSRKNNLSIVSAVTSVDLPDNKVVFLCVNEAIYNPDSKHTLLSVFQIRQFQVELDTTPKINGGLQ